MYITIEGQSGNYKIALGEVGVLPFFRTTKSPSLGEYWSRAVTTGQSGDRSVKRDFWCPVNAQFDNLFEFLRDEIGKGRPDIGEADIRFLHVRQHRHRQGPTVK